MKIKLSFQSLILGRNNLGDFLIKLWAALRLCGSAADRLCGPAADRWSGEGVGPALSRESLFGVFDSAFERVVVGEQVTHLLYVLKELAQCGGQLTGVFSVGHISAAQWLWILPCAWRDRHKAYTRHMLCAGRPLLTLGTTPHPV